MVMRFDNPSVGIVIPYYQREPGLLANCLRSIFAQESFDNYTIIIVDDGSPQPAEYELNAVSPPTNVGIKLVKQPNRGPGAARNTGLNNLIAGTRYVTFLDSDDQWTPTFLADAVTALEKGFDLFFGNSHRVGHDRSRFEWSEDPKLQIRPGDHITIDKQRDLYAFQGDFFDFLVYRSNIFGATTMVYRFQKYPDVRFSEKLFNGQDRLFKLSLKEATKCVAFSPKIYAFEGKGVNIFDRSQWGAERSLGFLSSYIELPKTILEQIELNPAQRKHVLAQLNSSRYSFIASILHLMKSGKNIDWQIVLATCRRDPMTAIMFVPNLVKIVSRRASTD